ncbi:hypothetical protein [Alkaliphilus metalliredigens]|nr:hypothetical protein [Alkaliphilus metalliredigens]
MIEKIFKNNGVCDIPIDFENPIKAIKAIKKDGGIAILAHLMLMI